MILSLLILWFALFLFFGILYVEVFGLTRWESAETHNENYTSLGRALVMLAFMSTGYGFYTHIVFQSADTVLAAKGGISTCTTSECDKVACASSFIYGVTSTVAYPRCTNSSPEDPDSDCGSPGWAYFLFIAWNVLSMVSHYPWSKYTLIIQIGQYIFVNMFTG